MLTVELKWHKSNPNDPDPRTVISEARPAVVPGGRLCGNAVKDRPANHTAATAHGARP